MKQAKQYCVICRSLNAVDFARSGKFKYLKCLNCETVFLVNPESNKYYKKLYSYKKSNKKEAKRVNPALYFSSNFYPARKFRNVFGKLVNKSRAKSIRQISRDKDILDVGCGPGDFLLEMKKKGWNVYGVEIGDYLVGVAESKIGKGRVYKSDFNNPDFDNKKFNVVTVWHVLEHISDPYTFIKESVRSLKKKGLLVVEVPHSRALNFTLFKSFWTLLLPPQHLHLWSKTSFRKLFKDTPLEIKYIEYPVHFPFVFLSSIVKKNNKYLYFWPLLAPISVFFSIFSSIINKGDVIRVYATKK